MRERNTDTSEPTVRTGPRIYLIQDFTICKKCNEITHEEDMEYDVRIGEVCDLCKAKFEENNLEEEEWITQSEERKEWAESVYSQKRKREKQGNRNRN